MSETPEQFRDRIGRLHQGQMTLSYPWEGLSEGNRAYHGRLAAAVYAQALRDVADWLDEQAAGPVPTVFIATGSEFIETIDPWLTERGIDLEAGT